MRSSARTDARWDEAADLPGRAASRREDPSPIRSTPDLDEVMRGLVDDAISRGLLDDQPIVPINYRRVICLPDGSRVDVQIARLVSCEACGKIHGRDSRGCPRGSQERST